MVRLGDGRCLIQTLDFFTPIVDDPWTFGAIAAANSLSDVYAMGASPVTAMNILCWPEKTLSEEMLAQVLKGGADKIAEAGALLVGGHSVRDKEPKYGLSVTGIVDEQAVWTNAGARPGQVLVLTKPLGTGIITTAHKRGKCSDEVLGGAVETMLALNRAACEAAKPLRPQGCTDITGFGLAGHAWEMARASGVVLDFDAAALPLLAGALELAEAGHLTRGEKSNRALVGQALEWNRVAPALQSVIVDPQTSGGLLLALPADRASEVGPVVGRVLEGAPAVRVRG